MVPVVDLARGYRRPCRVYNLPYGHKFKVTSGSYMPPFVIEYKYPLFL